jgi:hypothetical protein
MVWFGRVEEVAGVVGGGLRGCHWLYVPGEEVEGWIRFIIAT